MAVVYNIKSFGMNSVQRGLWFFNRMINKPQEADETTDTMASIFGGKLIQSRDSVHKANGF